VQRAQHDVSMADTSPSETTDTTTGGTPRGGGEGGQQDLANSLRMLLAEHLAAQAAVTSPGHAEPRWAAAETASVLRAEAVEAEVERVERATTAVATEATAEGVERAAAAAAAADGVEGLHNGTWYGTRATAATTDDSKHGEAGAGGDAGDGGEGRCSAGSAASIPLADPSQLCSHPLGVWPPLPPGRPGDSAPSVDVVGSPVASPCAYFIRGQCRYGADCRNTHSTLPSQLYTLTHAPPPAVGYPHLPSYGPYASPPYAHTAKPEAATAGSAAEASLYPPLLPHPSMAGAPTAGGPLLMAAVQPVAAPAGTCAPGAPYLAWVYPVAPPPPPPPPLPSSRGRDAPRN
jgi:hypothetical protein